MKEDTKVTKVFLPWISRTEDDIRDKVRNVLEKAEMDVYPKSAFPANEADFFKEVKNALEISDCSVHILTNLYGQTLSSDFSTSFSKYQFIEAKNKLTAEQADMKMFIWYPAEMVATTKDKLQQEFINEVRHSIVENMIFTNVSSPLQLVDDIRSMMEGEEKTKFDISDKDIFIMFNELDESKADEIIDMLSDIVDVEKLNIIQDSDRDYSELCLQQIDKSKLAVVYFKDTAVWALPFVQQVWKKVGGASSHTPILLIGDSDPESNINEKFEAPKVISLIISGELIPLEIKVQFDKVVEAVE